MSTETVLPVAVSNQPLVPRKVTFMVQGFTGQEKKGGGGKRNELFRAI
jgi:hypothetical protein